MPSPYWSSRYLTNNVRIISLSMLKSPSTEQIKITRKTLGFTQKESAEMVHCSLRAWQLWEAGDRTMPAGIWELFVIKTGLHPLYVARS
jgi:putative transcriptional regulator